MLGGQPVITYVPLMLGVCLQVEREDAGPPVLGLPLKETMPIWGQHAAAAKAAGPESWPPSWLWPGPLPLQSPRSGFGGFDPIAADLAMRQSGFGQVERSNRGSVASKVPCNKCLTFFLGGAGGLVKKPDLISKKSLKIPIAVKQLVWCSFWSPHVES